MTLSEFESYVDNYLENNTYKNRKFLLLDLNSGLLIKLINNILNNDTDLKKIANQSYQHLNGFHKILFIDKRPQYAIRLHLWNGLYNSHIHNHPWDMSGIILYGSYNWKLYNINENTKVKDFYKYQCIYDKDFGGHKFVNEESISMNKYFDIVITKNSLYNVNSEIYHKISNFTDEETASIIIHSNIINYDTHVVSKSKLKSNKPINNQNYTITMLRKLLNNFINNYRS